MSATREQRSGALRGKVFYPALRARFAPSPTLCSHSNKKPALARLPATVPSLAAQIRINRYVAGQSMVVKRPWAQGKAR
jgi:hypothetical protein